MADHTQFYAHSLSRPDGTPLSQDHWELLETHLHEVAELAAQFATEFDAANWGTLCGLWHDLGKYSAEFQDYLLRENGFEAHLEQHPGRVDHSTAGAQHAVKISPTWGRLIAYLIAGHHAGLCDAGVSPSSLSVRLKKEIKATPAAPAELLDPGILPEKPLLEFREEPCDVAFQLAFFTRMVFSCLVDADFLCTEHFMNPAQTDLRPARFDAFPLMKAALDRAMDTKASTAPDGTVSRYRQEVLAACREAASKPPGIYSLTVPTGGGKTLASLTFALDHAITHQKSRVIYAIPFTSIIEQTANVFREVFDSLETSVVLEHHSNLDPDSKHETPQSRLAAENWDAPLVVTTNVQFYESLFAAKTSRCRKLHNLVNSVIILDEVQTLPVERLRPCIAVLDELVRNYRCTILLCTATQPAIQKHIEFPIGLESVTEIVPDPGKLYREMKRVRVEQLGELSDPELVARLANHDSFLTIVNTRGHAAKLYRELAETIDDSTSLFHLSTYLCGEHRSDEIKQIRQRLHDRLPCKVISTQLIEAGVDVDFPVVYRASTGIDSIAQAAGRCNREGTLTAGNVYVFEPSEVRLIGYLKSVAHTTSELAPDFPDLLDPAAIEAYFSLHYWKQAGDNLWDKTPEQGVMNCFPYGSDFPFDFRIAADRFRLIEENGRTIFVEYNSKGQRLIEQLRADGPSRKLLRQLQRFSVTLFEPLYLAMLTDIEVLFDQYPVLINKSSYDKKLGVRFDRPGYHDPSQLIL